MTTFRKILAFYIESSLHVALAVYALICITFLKLGIPYDGPVAYFGFFGTIVGYNFVKYDELARVKKVVLTPTFKTIIGLSFIAGLATFYYFLELQTKTKWIGFIALFITIIYTLPFFPRKQNMRNWSGVKIYLVAIAWVIVTVVLPVFDSNHAFDIVVLLKCLQRFIFVFVLLLIFEIIDLQFDSKKLQTIPQRIGIKLTKYLAYLLLVIFIAMDFLKPNISQIHLMTTISIAILIAVFTFFANGNRNKYYTSFWVESIPLFWLLLLLVF